MSNVGDKDSPGSSVEEEAVPVVSKRPTRDDLKAACAAASSAVAAVGSMLSDMETGPVRVPRDEDDPDPDPDGAEPSDSEGPEMELRGSARPGQTGTGPSAMETGHGMMRMGPRQSSRPAFEQFMASLREPISRAGDRVRVSEIAGWVKIEGMQGHKVYIAKTVTGVSRVESTLDPRLISGARPPDAGRRNGRIASWLPARIETVGEAIELLSQLDEPPPARTPGRR